MITLKCGRSTFEVVAVVPSPIPGSAGAWAYLAKPGKDLAYVVNINSDFVIPGLDTRPMRSNKLVDEARALRNNILNN